MARRAPKPTPESDAIRAEHRSQAVVEATPDQLPLGETKREIVPPETKSYLVVGHKEVFGHKHGDVFDMALTNSQAQNLIEAGHLLPAGEAPEPEPVQEDVAPEGDQDGQLPEEVKE